MRFRATRNEKKSDGKNCDYSSLVGTQWSVWLLCGNFFNQMTGRAEQRSDKAEKNGQAVKEFGEFDLVYHPSAAAVWCAQREEIRQS